MDAITREYRDALSKVPALHDQGDGMRSMMGLLLAVASSKYPVVLIDEPEAFLHPPQARILGVELARLAERNGIQIIVATHDRNLVTGILDANEGPSSSQVDVSVVRLARKGKVATVFQVPADDLRTIWADPVLKHSNLLDGLFSTGRALSSRCCSRRERTGL